MKIGPDRGGCGPDQGGGGRTGPLGPDATQD